MWSESWRHFYRSDCDENIRVDADWGEVEAVDGMDDNHSYNWIHELSVCDGWFLRSVFQNLESTEWRIWTKNCPDCLNRCRKNRFECEWRLLCPDIKGQGIRETIDLLCSWPSLFLLHSLTLLLLLIPSFTSQPTFQGFPCHQEPALPETVKLLATDWECRSTQLWQGKHTREHQQDRLNTKTNKQKDLYFPWPHRELA